MNIFEQVIERRKTRSVKWDRMEMIYGIEDASDILPMWVADMDFAGTGGGHRCDERTAGSSRFRLFIYL